MFGRQPKPQRDPTPFFRWDLPRTRRGFWREISPPQLLVGSFLLLIVLGTIGFKVLPGLYPPGREALSWVDALFTATSAVCVTGLIVVDTATQFTQLGQLYILMLIQVGGLSIIALTSLVIVAIGQRLSLRHEELALAGADVLPRERRQKLIRDVVLFTLVIEGVGAVCLYPFMAWQIGWAEAVWPAMFHSVSAFCNAGFSTFSDNLMGFRHNAGVQLVIMALIVLGGIGFLTLEEVQIALRARGQKRGYRVSLHTRIVLVTTAVLILAPVPLFVLFEKNATLGAEPWWSQVLNATFMSVTARTAGFNTIDYSQATESSNFLTILLMSVGGSPGSTAGGLKTTTVALMALLAWSRFRGREVVSAASRSVREETLQRAVGLFVVGFGVATLGIFAVTATERWSTASGQANFLAHMFEAVSALNTVGLSMNVTPTLSPAGKVTMVLLMFLGRVGLLTLAAAIAKREATHVGEFRYAYEDVVVG